MTISKIKQWNKIKIFLKVGTKLKGIVTKHFPFGIFISISGIEFIGLVQITDFKDEGIMSPSDYPEIGSSVDVVVLGFKETGQQIWLGMKPSHLNISNK